MKTHDVDIDGFAFDFDDTNRVDDYNGWFEVARNPISRAGVFPYLGKNLKNAPDPAKVYRVYRPVEELTAPDFLASLRLIPWIDEHTMLGARELNATPAEYKGVQGVTGENIFFDSEDGTLYTNIKCFSETLAKSIDNGKNELSLGMRCKYDWTPGVINGQPYDCVQRKLRANHLASVDEGRMGPDVAVLDENDVSTETKESKMTIEELLAAIKAMSGDLEAIKQIQAALGALANPTADAPTDAPVVPALDEDAPGTTKAADGAPPTTATDEGDDPAKTPTSTTATDEDDADEAAMDAAIKGLRGDVATVRKAIPTFKSIAQQIARRDALAKRLSGYVGVFDHAEMTPAEVAAYGIKHLKLTCAKGAELATLEGYMQAKPANGAKVYRSGGGDGFAFDAADKPKTSAIDAALDGLGE